MRKLVGHGVSEPDQKDYLIACLIFVLTMCILLATTEIGFPRDESFYFHAADEYLGWFEELWTHLWNGNLAESFTKKNIDKHWEYNVEHPGLMKALFGLSYKFFADLTGLLDRSTALRLPGMATGAITVAVTYLFGRHLFGQLAGLVGAGLLLFQPRFFFHAHLACFDVPITAMWLCVVYAYWRGLSDTKWGILTGLLWGVALSIKLNAFFLPVVLGLHWLLRNWHQCRFKRRDESWIFRMPSIPGAFFAMLILGPLVFYVLWPRLWHKPIDHVMWYMEFHLEHTHYFVHYFGENLKRPPQPMGFPWIMTLITVPVITLFAFGYGLWALVKTGGLTEWARRWVKVVRKRVLPEQTFGRESGVILLLLINTIFPIALISLPGTPVFGGTKHWMPAMPFLSIIAGVGVAWAVESLFTGSWIEERWRPLVMTAMVLVVLSPSVYATGYSHPFGTSYYNGLIGSYQGAADAEMMRQFWGYSSRQALPWLNESAEKNAGVWIHNMTGYAWDDYRKEGLVRSDLRAVGRSASDYALYHHQKAFIDKLTDVWIRYETYAPSHVVTIDNVPLISVYRRSGTPKE